MIPTTMYLDRDVGKVDDSARLLAVEIGVARHRRYQRNDAASPPRCHLPEVQIGDANVIDAFELGSKPIFVFFGRTRVEKLSCRTAAEAPRPIQDDEPTDDAHQ